MKNLTTPRSFDIAASRQGPILNVPGPLFLKSRFDNLLLGSNPLKT